MKSSTIDSFKKPSVLTFLFTHSAVLNWYVCTENGSLSKHAIVHCYCAIQASLNVLVPFVGTGSFSPL